MATSSINLPIPLNIQVRNKEIIKSATDQKNFISKLISDVIDAYSTEGVKTYCGRAERVSYDTFFYFIAVNNITSVRGVLIGASTIWSFAGNKTTVNIYQYLGTQI